MITADVIAHLLAEPQVVALFGQRIQPNTLAQGIDKPCAAVTEIVTVPTNSLCGYRGLRNSKVQVDVYAVATGTKSGAKAASDAADLIEQRMRVKASGFSCLLQSRVSDFDDAVQEHHVRMDFSLWSKS